VKKVEGGNEGEVKKIVVKWEAPGGKGNKRVLPTGKKNPSEPEYRRVGEGGGGQC